ncbi:MAG: glutamate-5-semialdehyde dehydrogenase [Opitutales bacterium]|nr:glutamate-5-semialdehyde dehydrogenase [Opitutales bacterium]
MSPQSDFSEAALIELAKRARAASLSLATLPESAKNAFLDRLADALPREREAILAANKRDLEAGAESGLGDALLDRLRLTDARLDGMIEGIRQVAALPDPVGTVLEERTHAKGFSIRKVRVPIGVVGIIYESRPNVTVDCAILCLKSGNATILRGGKEAFHTNTALAEIIRASLEKAGITPDAVQLVPTTDRAALNILLKLDDYIHCLIPRGGEGLIRFVAENARMPVIKHYKGVCNVYLDEAADPAMALSVTVNAKCQRPSVCNAAENLVVHRALLDTVLPTVARELRAQGVELRADEPARAALAAAGVEAGAVSADDYDTEYLDRILAVKTVADADEAIAFINAHGSGHSDAIVTADRATADRFLAGVDAAAVYWNVSTRFTDGFEFGLGAEIGISTDKLHARGPMGLNELTSYKFTIVGDGQVR